MKKVSRINLLLALGMVGLCLMVIVIPFTSGTGGGVLLVGTDNKTYYVEHGVSVEEQGKVIFILGEDGKPVKQFYKSYYRGYVVCKRRPTELEISGLVKR